MPHLAGRCDCGREMHFPKSATIGDQWTCRKCGKVWTRSNQGIPLDEKGSKPPPNPHKNTSSSDSTSNTTPQSERPPVSYVRSISFLFYAGIIMTLAVQFAHANTWALPLFKSYEDAFATSLFLTVCGVAHTACIWENGYVGFGLILTTIGGFAWKYKWVLPVVKTYGVPLCFGILFILYGIVPQLLGGILITAGSLLLIVELWLAFTKGLAAVHYGNLLVSVIFIGLSTLMFRRQKKLARTGAFRSREAKDS